MEDPKDKLAKRFATFGFAHKLTFSNKDRRQSSAARRKSKSSSVRVKGETKARVNLRITYSHCPVYP
jgi:hypothetical protein